MKLCKDCEYFEIIQKAHVINGECWDFGTAICKKHNLETDFRNQGKFKKLKCIEEEIEHDAL